jgi:hypothetical protein
MGFHLFLCFAGPEEINRASRNESGNKEGQAGDMVPMVMGEYHRNLVDRIFRDYRVTEWNNASAGVTHHHVISDSNFDARGVAPGSQVSIEWRRV